MKVSFRVNKDDERYTIIYRNGKCVGLVGSLPDRTRVAIDDITYDLGVRNLSEAKKWVRVFLSKELEERKRLNTLIERHGDLHKQKLRELHGDNYMMVFSRKDIDEVYVTALREYKETMI